MSERADAAAERERAAQHRETAAAARDRSQAAADEQTRIRGRAADERDHAAADRDHEAFDRDQSRAAGDQRTWTRDRAAGEREHAAGDRDRNASNRDQADIDQRSRPQDLIAGALNPGSAGVGASRPEGEQQTSNRRKTAEDREHALADRRDDASDRDQSRTEGDYRAADRGHAVDDRVQAAADRVQTASDRGQAQAQADQRTANRGRAVDDRAHAADDRQNAAADRAAAERDHRRTRDELAHALLDELTGAFGRRIGLLLLERDLDRARRGTESLVIAYIDVDGLKQVNDLRGHTAGDQLLRDVTAAIKKHLRSYDTLVRVGGDEFLCGLVGVTPEVARDRFEEISATIVKTQPTASISVGYAELGPDDTLEQLTRRGDLALYEAKRSGERID